MTEVLMGEYWMVSIDAYYAALRLEMVKKLAVIYEQEKTGKISSVYAGIRSRASRWTRSCAPGF